jgi:hypothetical protein
MQAPGFSRGVVDSSDSGIGPDGGCGTVSGPTGMAAGCGAAGWGGDEMGHGAGGTGGAGGAWSSGRVKRAPLGALYWNLAGTGLKAHGAKGPGRRRMVSNARRRHWYEG